MISNTIIRNSHFSLDSFMKLDTGGQSGCICKIHVKTGILPLYLEEGVTLFKLPWRSTLLKFSFQNLNLAKKMHMTYFALLILEIE